MKKNYIVIIISIILILSNISIYSEEKTITWQKMYGGSDEDCAYSIQITDDGGYIIAGYSSSKNIKGVKNHGKRDCYIIKLDSNGNITWQKMYGGSGDDWASSIQQTNDGGYIVTGTSSSEDIPGLKNKGSSDIYIIKLDYKGNIKWHKMYGGNGEDEALSAQQTSDGGYIIAGYTNSNNIIGMKYKDEYYEYFYVLKLDSKGDIQWQKLFGGSQMEGEKEFFESAFSIQQTNDGGYIVTGPSGANDISGVKNNGNCDYFILKLDSDGNIILQKMYGGSGYDKAYCVQQTNNGGYIVAGFSDSTDIPGIKNNGYMDIYIIKIDLKGNIEWQKMYGGSGYDKAFSIQQTEDGGYIIAGLSDSTDIPGVKNNGGDSIYIIKINSKGDIIWQRIYGGSDYDGAYSIFQDKDGGYIVAGDSYSTDISGLANNGKFDFYILKLDANGNLGK